jgi:hypothetical protein
MSKTRKNTRIHDVYRNLHTSTWSLVYRPTGRVQDHPIQAAVHDAVFVVQPAGNRRTREEKRKVVHAFVRGFVGFDGDAQGIEGLQGALGGEWKRITYNPYKHTTFVFADTEQPISKADWVVLKDDGTAWTLNGR